MSSSQIKYTLGCLKADEQLQYENYQVLSAVQVLAGAITPNMIAVALTCLEAEVHFEFYLENESELDRELIDDVITDMEALQFTAIPISHIVTVVGNSLDGAMINGRVLFRRHVATSAG